MVLDLVSYAIIFFISSYVVWFIFARGTRPSPLRLPPSPISLPFIGHLHLLDVVPYKSFYKLTNYYGPLIHIRLGSVPCIVTSSPELAKEFLFTNELTFASRPITFASRPITIATHHLTYNSSGFTFVTYGPQWKFMKKICMSNLLGGKNLAKAYPIRRNELKRFMQLLVENSIAGEAVDLSEELVKLSNAVVTRMMFKPLGKNDQTEEVRVLAREVTEIFGNFNLSDFVWFLRNFDLQGLHRKSKNARRRYDVLLERLIKEHQEVRDADDGDGARDFLDILLDIYEDDNSEIRLSRDHIKAFVLDVLTAGTDTSAAATEWAMSELINYPTILNKARKEIDTVVGKNSRLVEESDLPNLPYIQAIFRETLRLHPPAPMLARESSQDCKVGGYDIPANTQLFVNVWSINRNPDYWDNPLEFRPERFILEHDGQSSLVATDVRGQHFTLLPFGTGRRGCPGMWLALQQVPTVLAALIQCFDWKTIGHSEGIKPGTVDMTERPGLTIPRANPLVLLPVIRFNPFITENESMEGKPK